MNPYNAVKQFEETIAEYAGSKYAVAVESGTMAIYLSLFWKRCQLQLSSPVIIPKFTYPSVANSILHLGCKVQFSDEKWQGTYELFPISIVDGALRFKKGMYQGGLHCLSFHTKKQLPIGRGGMILTDDLEASKWLKLARFDGRDEIPLSEQKDITVAGFNAYMTPEQAVRGLELFETIKDRDLPDLKVEEQGYPDLSKFSIYK